MASANQVTTGKVRFSYVHLDKPVANQEGGEPKYSISLIISKSDTDTINRINQAIDSVKNDPVNAAKWGGSVPKVLRGSLRDGDAEKEDPAYANSYFINARAGALQKPKMFNANKEEILDPSEVYSGCFGKASISFFAYNAAGNKGIGCGLNAVMKLEDGEKLGGNTVTADVFDI